MRSDGEVLPDLHEAVILHDLGLVRTDQLPGLAARWLATDVADTESVRILAGHDARDPWGLEGLLAASVTEAAVEITADQEQQRLTAIDWVTSNWRLDHATRSAVRTLARLGQTHLELDLDFVVGLDDEWSGGWGRLSPDLDAAAEQELNHPSHGQPESGPNTRGRY